MGVYHQMGHDSQNLLSEENLQGYRGALLSPVNYTATKIKNQIENCANDDFEIIFDPQLYFPQSERGKLPSWSYFPQDVDTADQSSSTWWNKVNADIVQSVTSLQPHAVCSPAVVPRLYSDEYYNSSVQVANKLKEQLSKIGIDVLMTVLASIGDLTAPTRAAEIASIVSRANLDRIFLVLISDVEPRRELTETEDLKGAMRLIRYLKNSGLYVLVGFSSSDVLLWKVAGADDCASGKFFNLRRFTPSRWYEPAEGGGQLPYWFEESLMAYLRESDLERIRKAGLLSDASDRNPYAQEILNILDQRDSNPEKPWLGLSWRQYMYWLSDFEDRYRNAGIDPHTFLKRAENLWRKLDESNILMEERQNDGSWLRSWRRAVIEAFPDK